MQLEDFPYHHGQSQEHTISVNRTNTNSKRELSTSFL